MEKSGFGFATRSIGSKQKWNVSRWPFPGGGCIQPARHTGCEVISSKGSIIKIVQNIPGSSKGC